MQNLATQNQFSLEEYIELEKNSDERIEYYAGTIWSMAGASAKHEIIVGNTITGLNVGLRGRGCRVYGSNLRVKVPECPPYRYPDVAALCDEPIYEDLFGLEVLTNPSLIVEILSPSTILFDIGDKFTYYKSIASFTEYLLIDQEKPHVVLYTKQDEKVWLHREFNSLTEIVHLTSLNCDVSLKDIYENIEFVKNDKIPPFSIV